MLLIVITPGKLIKGYSAKTWLNNPFPIVRQVAAINGQGEFYKKIKRRDFFIKAVDSYRSAQPVKTLIQLVIPSTPKARLQINIAIMNNAHLNT